MLALNETGYAGIALFDPMLVREIDWFVSDRGFEDVIVGVEYLENNLMQENNKASKFEFLKYISFR